MDDIEKGLESRQRTAKRAVMILSKSGSGFIVPTSKQRLNVLIAFAKNNKVVYGKAFDILKIEGANYNLDDLEWIENNLKKITVCEVKSTNKLTVKAGFEKYFFGLTTAELLVAQSLKEYFKFVFVNTNSGEILELSLDGIYKKAKGIYPTWSIQF